MILLNKNNHPYKIEATYSDYIRASIIRSYLLSEMDKSQWLLGFTYIDISIEHGPSKRTVSKIINQYLSNNVVFGRKKFEF